MKKNSIISIDMGGTKVLACVVNSKEGIVAKLKRPTDPTDSAKDYVHQLAKIVKDLIDKNEISKKKIKTVCLGIPGSLNPVTGKIGLAPNLGLKNFNIKYNLEKELNFPVLIENDANLGALGIKNFGVGKKSKNLLAVFVGTGIGGGLIFDRQLYRGSDFVAGEIGHMLVKKNGPKCGCGKNGCFEALASRTAVVNKIISDIELGKASVLSRAVKSGDRIKSKLLLAAVTKNDKVTCKRIREACTTIGKMLASVTNLLNLDTIILAGGMVDALDFYMLPLIKKSFDEHVLADAGNNLKIVSSQLGDDAAIFGGIPLAEEFLGIKV
ncbi:MAG: ROK family protein [Ignavibacteria bacterium]|nr:ROK family protein [Ignavibacteria bacterium]MBT8383928.1 ROK family protein [Ignavibacteria bacterium]MBT8391471.1 ROK family protein [Ignavibacteria bacterium]NNJ54134.1 ROK family protein [Ignavibacteriaceae bacterium]NNL21401.1 ROK family protein [Ignavibacteriaceae bacterium]